MEESPVRGSAQTGVIETVTANCQDCYRCVRVCPVKAIRVTGGQARVVEELCIQCGTCVRECPQHAKIVTPGLALARDLIASGRPVAASVAPSFAALYPGWSAARLPSALRALGFSHVAETAEGAERISLESLEKFPDTCICTACPTVVNYVEKYCPDLADQLVPVVSPMVAHGRMLKKKYGSRCAVVFIGPCAAKKGEARRPENRDAVDAVLTFEELSAWLEEEEIDLATCADSGFETTGLAGGPLDSARLFPLEGGMLKTCGLTCNSVDTDILHVSGAEAVTEAMHNQVGTGEWRVIEPLFCAGGCIAGPCLTKGGNVFERQRAVVAYAHAHGDELTPENGTLEAEELKASFRTDAPARLPEVDEAAIQRVMEMTGKGNPELQLNCGACGYASCREKAIAVARGLAEPEMCLPYMRRLAQQRTDKIIETTPNGIVILDDELNMIHMNRAFQKMFLCNGNVLGRKLSYIIDADGFDSLVAGTAEQTESIRVKNGKKYHETLYALRDEGQYVGIYTDVSRMKFDAAQIDLIKRQTLEHAKSLLDQQIRFSQEMAHYLGKSTAQNEEIVRRMMELYADDDEKKQGAQL